MAIHEKIKNEERAKLRHAELEAFDEDDQRIQKTHSPLPVSKERSSPSCSDPYDHR